MNVLVGVHAGVVRAASYCVSSPRVVLGGSVGSMGRVSRRGEARPFHAQRFRRRRRGAAVPFRDAGLFGRASLAAGGAGCWAASRSRATASKSVAKECTAASLGRQLAGAITSINKSSHAAAELAAVAGRALARMTNLATLLTQEPATALAPLK